MPPKKLSAKAVAAEVKKQNTIKAQNIVSQLKVEMGKTGTDPIVKKPATKKSVTTDSSKKRNVQIKDVSAKSKGTTSSVLSKVSTSNEGETNQNCPLSEEVANSGTSKLVEMTAVMKPVPESSIKRIAQNENIVSKSKRIKSQVGDSDLNGEVSDVGLFAEQSTNSETGEHFKTPSKNYKSQGRTSSSNEPGMSGFASKATNKNYPRPWEAHSSHGVGYQYEIDCAQVSDCHVSAMFLFLNQQRN